MALGAYREVQGSQAWTVSQLIHTTHPPAVHGSSVLAYAKASGTCFWEESSYQWGPYPEFTQQHLRSMSPWSPRSVKSHPWYFSLESISSWRWEHWKISASLHTVKASSPSCLVVRRQKQSRDWNHCKYLFSLSDVSIKSVVTESLLKLLSI